MTYTDTELSGRLTLGERLRRARTMAAMKQDDIANAVGVSRVSVSSYERDEVEPNFAIVCLWAIATGVPLAFFADAAIAGTGLESSAAWEPASSIRQATHDARVESPAHVIDLTVPWPHHVDHTQHDSTVLPFKAPIPIHANQQTFQLTA